jgi:hypothetical protein
MSNVLKCFEAKLAPCCDTAPVKNCLKPIVKSHCFYAALAPERLINCSKAAPIFYANGAEPHRVNTAPVFSVSRLNCAPAPV